MQVKKEEMKDQILKSGYTIFSEVGFEKASLRKIVKEAGTTIGNFYNYFENKEALFDQLVRAEYEQFTYFLNHHEEESEKDVDLKSVDIVALFNEGITEFITSIIPVFTPNFLLLIDKSEGTKYAGFKGSMVDFFEEHYLEHVQSYGDQLEQKKSGVESDQYGRILSEMFVEGLIKVIRTYMGQEIMAQKIARHFMFFTIGTMGILDNDARKKSSEV